MNNDKVKNRPWSSNHSGFTYMHHGTFSGTWANNQPLDGVWIAPGGIFYKGTWCDGKYHGKGTLSWAGWFRYEGEWRFDKAQGQGTETYCSGRLYHSGLWDNNEPVGVGPLTLMIRDLKNM